MTSTRTRQTQIDRFLSGTIWNEAIKSPLNQDASFRQYTRLNLATQSAMLMDALPPEKPVSHFDQIAKHLDSLNIKAPQSYKTDEENSLMLLEDLGDMTFTKALHQDYDEAQLYAMATDLLTKLHSQKQAADIALPPYNLNTLQQEAALLTQWFYPYIVGTRPTEEISESYQNAWKEVILTLDQQSETLVLRDYHVDNLMVIKQNGTIQCAVLDFQDALLGHPAYDLVSLLQDARRDIPTTVVNQMLERYFVVTKANQAQFMLAYHVLGAQRHCKVLGIFVRLYERDAKPIYLQHLPRVVSLLSNCLAQPNLKPVKHWFEQYLPLHHLTLPEFHHAS